MTGDERRQRPLVVVVDDDDDMLGALEYLLSEHGYDVRAAHSGPEVLRAAHEAPEEPRERPALIIVDLMMPRMDGEELLAALGETPWRDVPALLMSAHRDVVAPERPSRARAALTKPIDLDQLFAAIEALR